MSSKRGRKRNDNLPPNRARDVQRAFRARRAAHLEALEQRVAELEDENNALRAALNLPPANRAPLGKGPTGKDKPKSHIPGLQTSQSSTSSLPPISALPHISPTISNTRTDSPSSASDTRTQSLSPTVVGATLAQANQSVVPTLESANWPESMFMEKDQPEASTSTSSGYAMPSVVSASSSYPPSTSRQTFPEMYLQSVTQNYPHTADRPMGTETYSSHFTTVRDERRTFPYSQAAFPPHAPPMHSQSPHLPPVSSAMAPQGGSLSIPSPLSYTHRRSITEPQGYRNMLPQMRQAPPPPIRLPSPSMLPQSNAPNSVYDARKNDRMH
ncbi:hypothetical protein BKA93DRAFT_818450 [Sparassis latifolia]